MPSSRLPLLALVTLMVVAAAPARAQGAPQGGSRPLTVGWQDGLVVQSADGDYRLQLGTVFQADGRFSLDEPLPITNTFAIRKARVMLAGRLARYFEFRVMPDFGGGNVQLVDMFIDTLFSKHFRVRIGKDKAPVGYELLIADGSVWFPERALVSSLVPNRDLGVQARGDLASGKVSFAAGVFNGVPDGTSGDSDTNNAKDLIGRVVYEPVRGIGVHLGASTGMQANGLPVFRTSIGQPFFAYAPGTVASGRRDRVSPAVFVYRKAFGAFAEYVRSTQAVARGAVRADAANEAWNVSAGYALTGEAVSDRNIRPDAPFDPPAHAWGAVELLARYSALRVDDDVFGAGLAAPGASRTADQYAVAVDWYPTSFIKWYATYERTSFNHDTAAPRHAENAVIVRAQLAF